MPTEEISKNDIYIDVKTGLGNRLWSIVPALCSVYETGGTVYCRWDLTPACSDPFTEMFEVPPQLKFVESTAQEEMLRARVRPERQIGTGSPTNLGRNPASYLVCEQLGFNGALWAPLYPAQRWKRFIDTFAKAHNIDRAIGLHVRMSDNLHMLSKFGLEKPTIEGFFKFVDGQPEDSPIFLATDSAEAQRVFRARYGHRVVTATEIEKLPVIETPHGTRIESGAAAVPDLFLLARCAVFMGTYYSSFSDIAYLLRITHQMTKADENCPTSGLPTPENLVKVAEPQD